MSIEKDGDLLPYTSSGCMEAWILFLVEELENVHNTLILENVLLPFSNCLYISIHKTGPTCIFHVVLFTDSAVF